MKGNSMLNLHQVTTFVTVLSEGSMTAAADKLFLTQPAVSQQIRNLEEELGVELLVRGVRQIKATPQGEILYEHSRRILQMVQQAEVAIKSIGAELNGLLRIGTLNSIGLHLMSPIVSRLLRNNPELSIRIDYDQGEELIKKFKKNLIDVLIIPEAQEEFGIDLDGVEAKFLIKEEMWLVGSGKDTEIPQQAEVRDLNDFPFISFMSEFPGFEKNLQLKLDAAEMNIGPIFESSNVGTLKRVIESNLGWGFLPAHSVKKQVRSGRLNRVYLKDFHYEMDLIYYYKKNSENKKVAETFFQTLSQQEKNHN